ncbi:MAG: SDR family NAD(P)-dependent oxidoreductase [Myxococcales bacterium]|nr:SDR family NAD(P)-dependent oxidoreductase [Myxococcales bacterium]
MSSEALVFITGASSGIGLALARSVPFESRVFAISRRGAPGAEHFPADLADPASWARVGELFAREMAGFAGGRVVLIHSAGTLAPMGFAGEVDAPGYAAQVLLNAAAPQVLGEAFARASATCTARCQLLMIGSGAAHTVYEGWSAYCGGKAAVDHWVRTVGAEQSRRDGNLSVYSVAPGVVATAMQDEIREMSARDFPDLPKFVELHEQGILRDPAVVAADLWKILDSGLENGAVIDLRDA